MSKFYKIKYIVGGSTNVENSLTEVEATLVAAQVAAAQAQAAAAQAQAAADQVVAAQQAPVEPVEPVVPQTLAADEDSVVDKVDKAKDAAQGIFEIAKMGLELRKEYTDTKKKKSSYRR